MRVFFSLMVLSLILATCYGACWMKPFELEFINGTVAEPKACVDEYDGIKHLVMSTWITAHCFKCACGSHGMECCHRYGGLAKVEGCKAVVNPDTCEYEFYSLVDPSMPCPGMGS